MALRTSRLLSLHQDENVQANVSSSKNPLHEHKGLQQQHGLVECKKLSNITNNHVLSQPKHSMSTVEKESFVVLADEKELIPMPTTKKASKPPLKNTRNGTPFPKQTSSSKPSLKTMAEVKPETLNSTPSAFSLPPRSTLNLTEEMKKKAASWAEAGIERVYLTEDDDMEK